MDYENLLKELKYLRKSKGLSLEEMGRAVGVTGSNICFIELGKIPLKMQDFFIICETLEVSPQEVLSNSTLDLEHHGIITQLKKLSNRDFQIIKNMILFMYSHHNS